MKENGPNGLNKKKKRKKERQVLRTRSEKLHTSPLKYKVLQVNNLGQF